MYLDFYHVSPSKIHTHTHAHTAREREREREAAQFDSSLFLLLAVTGCYFAGAAQGSDGGEMLRLLISTALGGLEGERERERERSLASVDCTVHHYAMYGSDREWVWVRSIIAN